MPKRFRPDPAGEDRPKAGGSLRGDQSAGPPDGHANLDAPAAAEAQASTVERELRDSVNIYTSDNNLRPLAQIEADIIRIAIGHYGGRMSEVARHLGIGRSTLYRRLSELEIDETN